MGLHGQPGRAALRAHRMRAQGGRARQLPGPAAPRGGPSVAGPHPCAPVFEAVVPAGRRPALLHAACCPRALPALHAAQAVGEGAHGRRGLHAERRRAPRGGGERQVGRQQRAGQRVVRHRALRRQPQRVAEQRQHPPLPLLRRVCLQGGWRRVRGRVGRSRASARAASTSGGAGAHAHPCRSCRRLLHACAGTGPGAGGSTLRPASIAWVTCSLARARQAAPLGWPCSRASSSASARSRLPRRYSASASWAACHCWGGREGCRPAAGAQGREGHAGEGV